MDYFRHDLDLSDHHKHWHDLNPFYDVRQPALQGRLFLWMHQQMLARYNAERLAAGLAPVEPLLQWDNPVAATAFDDANLAVDPLAAWINVESPNAYQAFDHNGQSPRHLNAGYVTLTLDGLQRVLNALRAGSYATYNDVGRALESSLPQASPDDAGPHNMGHVSLGTLANGAIDVMMSPEVAMTTPIFYQWHRAIDDYGYQWQEAKGPDPWLYVTPPVTIRRALDGSMTSTVSPDVILTPRAAVDGITSAGFDLAAWGNNAFGGAKFDQAPAVALNVDTLRTQMIPDDLMKENRLALLDHWVYFLRLRNTTGKPAAITARVWLCPIIWIANRRAWIEMDKFTVLVPATSTLVVPRPAWHSTVIRLKTVGDPMTLANQDDQWTSDLATSDQAWCECGLPYRLLLPKGTSQGMSFRFMVLLTDAVEDGLAGNNTMDECGSVSYCAKKDLTWPDNKEMGFPFNRPFPSASALDPITAFFASKANVVWRDVMIRNVGPLGPIA